MIGLGSQDNLANSGTCEEAKRRMPREAPVVPQAEEPKYRDRAAERREVFNQSMIPLPEESPVSATSQKRKFAEGPAAPLPPPPPPLEPGKDANNIGNQMLARMGWQDGTGLGKEGQGRVAPVLAQQFESRAG
ncbi:hypothetical protein P7C73_g4696, partial [Tremellales sp. Uapishka_1]